MRSPCALLATLLCVGPALAAEPPVTPQDSWSLRVHLLGDDDRVELRRSTPGLEERVCRTPSNARVRFQPSDLFTLDGPGLAGSAPFVFHPRNGDITLRVRAGPQVPRTIGAVLMGSGLSVMGVTGLYALPQLAFGDVFCDQDPACTIFRVWLSHGSLGNRIQWSCK